MVGLVATERFIEWLIFSQFALPFSKTILKFPETVKRFVLAFLHQPSLRRHDAARNVGGVVGVAMNSVLLVHEHPEEPASMFFLGTVNQSISIRYYPQIGTFPHIHQS